ncbi:MAG: peptide MFS transporter [Deltaproteobacteria bacterium]|nr:peptide MFS transporter [Deltaproteobacteria bacterium]
MLKTTTASVATTAGKERHPTGLYVLFATEMWERFSFYSMLSLFTLYLQDQTQGFAWTTADATRLYANYMAFVYLSPLVGGIIADRKLGYRRSVMLGGLFFMAGHLLLAVPSVAVMYAALTCLVLGNGFFKPNVSAMVGALYPEGSHLKDRAYNIFYMGINIGAFLGPVVVEAVKQRFGYHPAFATAAGGMLVSIMVLWLLKRFIEHADIRPSSGAAKQPPARMAAHVAAIPERERIGALLVVYLIAIIFWMAFHQNFSTWTYWADNNTDWNVSGTIANAINPFFVITLTFPLVWFWQWLDRRGREPSTAIKMVMGMTLTALAYFVMTMAGLAGGDTGKVSPSWLIAAYLVLTLGELMLSPMALSLVSKLAPPRLRGLMMGGWFVATAIGNKLTAIGVYWDVWPHSKFFGIIGLITLGSGVLLLLLTRPLKKAMGEA